LPRVVHVQSRFAAFDLNLVFGPTPGYKSTYDSYFPATLAATG